MLENLYNKNKHKDDANSDELQSSTTSIKKDRSKNDMENSFESSTEKSTQDSSYDKGVSTTKDEGNLNLSIRDNSLLHDSRTIFIYSDLTYKVEEKDNVFDVQSFKRLFFDLKDRFNNMMYYGKVAEDFIIKEANVLQIFFQVIRPVEEDSVGDIFIKKAENSSGGLGVIEDINEFDKETLNA